MAKAKRLFQDGKQTVGSMKRLYHDQAKRAKRRGFSYELSFEQWLGLISLRCYLCNSKPANAYKHHDYGYKDFPAIVFQGIDRIDNSLGYTLDNVAPCCKICNYMKWKMSFSGLRNHIKKIVKFQKW